MLAPTPMGSAQSDPSEELSDAAGATGAIALLLVVCAFSGGGDTGSEAAVLAVVATDVVEGAPGVTAFRVGEDAVRCTARGAARSGLASGRATAGGASASGALAGVSTGAAIGSASTVGSTIVGAVEAGAVCVTAGADMTGSAVGGSTTSCAWTIAEESNSMAEIVMGLRGDIGLKCVMPGKRDEVRFGFLIGDEASYYCP